MLTRSARNTKTLQLLSMSSNFIKKKNIPKPVKNITVPFDKNSTGKNLDMSAGDNASRNLFNFDYSTTKKLMFKLILKRNNNISDFSAKSLLLFNIIQNNIFYFKKRYSVPSNSSPAKEILEKYNHIYVIFESRNFEMCS